MIRTLAMSTALVIVILGANSQAGQTPTVQFGVKSLVPAGEKLEVGAPVLEAAAAKAVQAGYPVLPGNGGQPAAAGQNVSAFKPKLLIPLQVALVKDRKTGLQHFEMSARVLQASDRMVLATGMDQTEAFSPDAAAASKNAVLREAVGRLVEKLFVHVARGEEAVARFGRDFSLTVEVQSYQELSLLLKQLSKSCAPVRKKKFSRKVASIDARCKITLDELQERVKQVLSKAAPGVAFEFTQRAPSVLTVKRK